MAKPEDRILEILSLYKRPSHYLKDLSPDKFQLNLPSLTYHNGESLPALKYIVSVLKDNEIPQGLDRETTSVHKTFITLVVWKIPETDDFYVKERKNHQTVYFKLEKVTTTQGHSGHSRRSYA
eukprot:1444877-Rhodomonas_salina.1